MVGIPRTSSQSERTGKKKMQAAVSCVWPMSALLIACGRRRRREGSHRDAQGTCPKILSSLGRPLRTGLVLKPLRMMRLFPSPWTVREHCACPSSPGAWKNCCSRSLAGHKALPLTTMWQETADRPTMIRRPDRLSKSGKAGADGQLPGLWRPCMSGLFPALRTMYGNRKYSAHLYMCFLAGAGAGKGVATHATLLGNPIHRELVKRNKIARREHENKLIEWELEVRQASKEKRKPDMELRPQETERDVLYLQANTSKSQMMHEMSGSSAHGNILYITEIDAFSEALQTDYGKHAAEIRMIFHHEKIGQSFKTDKEPIEIESPRLALMMTGTPQQLVNFIKTLEDGLFSRFLFYVMSTSYKWISQSPLDGNGSIDVNELFSPLAAQLKENFFNSLDKEIMIHFTRAQWDRHSETFQAHLGMVSAESDSAAYGIIFRAGLIVLRVAMVFCGLRILEAGWQVAEYTCTDEDFDAAMDIVLTCMSHTMNTSTMFNEAAKRHKLTNYYKLLPVLKKMNDRFKYSEFKTGANGLGIGDSSVKRALKKYIVTGLITKDNDGYRKTDLAKKCI